tara:strand:- start:8402 stop:9823 length:1422 start_codon:yes stop_codon:yes gene_type:complete
LIRYHQPTFILKIYFKFFVGLIFLWNNVPGNAIESSPPKTSRIFFKDTKVWDIEITVPLKQHKMLQPKAKQGYGMNFNYVRANINIAGQNFADIGLRYKGNSSFSSARDIPKKSFKIDFNRFIKDQKFLGLTKLNLNNNILDPSQIREALAYRLWSKIELPSPRATFARVTLTIPDQSDKKLLGLYVVVEQVNAPLLRERFGTDKGLLLKPEQSLSMPYLGENFEEYKRIYTPKSNAKPSLKKRFIEFTRLINEKEDEIFEKKISSYIDFRQLAKFTAAHTILSHLDSFLLRGHNYYIYLPKADSKLIFLPWDVNSTFASHRSAGSPEQQFNLSIKHPFPREQRLLERLIKLKSFRNLYDNEIKNLATTHFSKKAIIKDMTELRKSVETSVKHDEYSNYYEFVNNFQTPKASNINKMQGSFRPVRKPLLREFLIKRHESITAQWSENREGYTPSIRQRSNRRTTKQSPRKRPD